MSDTAIEHYKGLAAQYTGAIRASDFKANIVMFFLSLTMGPIIFNHDKFPRFLTLPVLVAPFIVMFLALFVALLPRYPKRGRASFFISGKATPADFLYRGPNPNETQELRLRVAILSDLLSGHVGSGLVGVFPGSRGHAGIAQHNGAGAAVFQSLLVQVAPGPVAAHNVRDLVRQDGCPQPVAGTGQPRQSAFHIDGSIGRRVGVEIAVVDDTQFPRKLALREPALRKLGLRKTSLRRHADLLDQPAENPAARGVAPRRRNALLHQLRAQSSSGFQVEIELSGNFGDVRWLLTRCRNYPDATQQGCEEEQALLGRASFHGAPPRTLTRT